jgi:hypothetical protein
MTRHLARARGACFSSGGASLGGHTRDGSSFAAIAGTPQRRARHVTHVSSLSDPLPEDIPSWTGQALDADETETLPFEAKSLATKTAKYDSTRKPKKDRLLWRRLLRVRTPCPRLRASSATAR